jgi:lipopolysaccharide export system protein LptA
LKSELNKQNIKHRHIVFFGVLCLFFAFIHAQIKPKQLREEVLQSMNPVKPTVKPAKTKSSKRIQPANPKNQLVATINPLANKSVTLVYLENCDALSFDKNQNPDMQVLKGNVRFRHDNARLYCDSAHFYEKANSLNAYGHVRIVQGDTLFIFGDLLYYDGNAKLARLRHRVRMENRKTTLTTDSLNYDRISNLAYYYTGGKITDQLNDLTSIWGQYSSKTNESLFKTTVHLNNKNFTLDADSLRYNTKTNIAKLISMTHVLYNNETDIFSNKGWYNTASEQSMLLNRSKIKHKDGKTLVGDTIFYDKKLKFGEGFTHVVMNDSVQKSTLYGDYCYYNEKTKTGLATDSALLVDWSGKDSMFVHADTLLTSKDSIYNVARGFFHVRFYKNDIQGLCDSLIYSSRDSVLNMYNTPVLWSDNNQLSGDYIQAFTKNKKVNKIHIQHVAVVIQHEDSVYFNQLSGKEIIAYVDSGQLRKVNVNGNAETIYFPRDDKDSTLVGLNRTQSSFVTMYFKNKKVQRAILTTSTNGMMFPIINLTDNKLYLKTFFWVEKERPKNRQDLFTVYPKIVRPKPGGIDNLNAFSDPQNSGNSSDNQPVNSDSNSTLNQNIQPQTQKNKNNIAF